MLRLRELREARNIKAKDVAEMLGVSYRNYQRYETGDIDTPSSKLVKLCDFFDVSADYLLGRSDEP